jgi:hypothetical protein
VQQQADKMLTKISQPPASVRNCSPSGSSGVQDELWLLGQPSLQDYLDFVRDCADGGAEMDPRMLVDEWRQANDHYGRLETAEAGAADEAEYWDLPEAMKPLAACLMEQPYFQQSFDRLPVTFAMVEIDSLIVYQTHVTLPFVEQLKTKLEPLPDPVSLFQFCQPVERRDPPVNVRRINGNRYIFTSDSTDFRSQGSLLLRPNQIVGHSSFGPLEAVLGVAVGFGSNFLSVVRSDRRMVLHNGYHRACALRAAGVTHAPAVVQTVTRKDELELVASQKVVDEPAFYFRAARPPLIKDFFDPLICKILPVRRMEKMIEVTLEVKEHDLPRI